MLGSDISLGVLLGINDREKKFDGIGYRTFHNGTNTKWLYNTCIHTNIQYIHTYKYILSMSNPQMVVEGCIHNTLLVL